MCFSISKSFFFHGSFGSLLQDCNMLTRSYSDPSPSGERVVIFICSESNDKGHKSIHIMTMGEYSPFIFSTYNYLLLCLGSMRMRILLNNSENKGLFKNILVKVFIMQHTHTHTVIVGHHNSSRPTLWLSLCVFVRSHCHLLSVT